MSDGKAYEREVKRGKAIAKLLVEFIDTEPLVTNYEGTIVCAYCYGDFGYPTKNKHEDNCLWVRVKKECADLVIEGVGKK